MSRSILHIFSDDKFIDWHILNFEKGNFKDTFVYLSQKNTYLGRYKITYIVPYSKDYYDLIKTCKAYDVLILYFLSRDKIDLINLLGLNRPKIIWSFYGADLYSLSNFSHGNVSGDTLALLTSNRSKILSYAIDYLRPFSDFIKGKYREKSRLREAISRIDYFSWYSKEEYDFLNKRMRGILPEFLELSLTTTFDRFIPIPEKLNGIFLGNSASPSNNHVDIIRILDRHSYSGSITIPMSYPKYASYISKIKGVCRISKLNVKIIEDFINYDDYGNLINMHQAAVFNSYRQLGIGNILIALKCGLKVYLNSVNPSFQWLRRLGFEVFSIDVDLEKDIVEGKLSLSRESMNRNAIVCKGVSDGSSNRIFLEKIRIISSAE